MNLLETTTHSFVIKIWQEETAVEARQGKWRGRITHVGSREHSYFEDLADIPRFISPYLGKSAREFRRSEPLLQKLRNYLFDR